MTIKVWRMITLMFYGGLTPAPLPDSVGGSRPLCQGLKNFFLFGKNFFASEALKGFILDTLTASSKYHKAVLVKLFQA